MNKDDDPRFVENGDYVDALNLTTRSTSGSGAAKVAPFGTEEIVNAQRNGDLFYDVEAGGVSGNEIEIPSHGLVTGDYVFVSGFGLSGNYFVIYIDDDTISLATTIVNANAGTAVSLSAVSGTIIRIYTLPSGTNTCIGGVDDPIRRHSYGFFHNSNGRHYILRYEYNTNIARLVIEDNSFAENYVPWVISYRGTYNGATSYVVEDVVVKNSKYYVCKISGTGNDPELKPVHWAEVGNFLNFDVDKKIASAQVIEHNGNVFLLWTDNNEQPSILNVTKAMSAGWEDNYPPIERKAIDLYAPQPQHPLSCAYGDDTTTLSNSTSKKVLQFRYRWNYIDGRVSAMSPISRIPLPTTDQYNQAITKDNKVDLKVPIYDAIGKVSGTTYKNNIESIDVFVKTNADGNAGDWYYVDNINVQDSTVSQESGVFSDRYYNYISYAFKNNVALAPVDQVLANQLYDYIPQKAASLAVVGNNRLCLGNVVEGFDFDPNDLDVTFTENTVSSAGGLNYAPKGSFKKNAKYRFGIVYGDRNGRLSTVYTNKSMEFTTSRSSSTNQQYTRIRMEVGHAPPDWADFWFPVYTKNLSYRDWIYTQVGAVATSGNFDTTPIDDIAAAQALSSKIKNYSYLDTDETDNQVRLIYEVAPPAFNTNQNETSTIVNATSNASVVYDNTPFSTAPVQNDIIEIFKPKLDSDDDTNFWYEMGWSFKIVIDANGNRVHGGEQLDYSSNSQDQIIGSGAQDAHVVLDQADCWVYNIGDLGISRSTGGGAGNVVFEFPYLGVFYDSRSAMIGRPNIVNDNFNQTTFEAQINYSEPYVDNTDFFGVNRFLDANFLDTINELYGGITHLYSYGDELFCLQDSRTCRMLANKYFIYNADISSPTVGQTLQFLSEPQYFPQEFGCQNAESFAAYGSRKFWVDRLRGAVLMSEGGSIEKISGIKMSTYFEKNLAYPFQYNNNAQGNKNFIYGVYDELNSEYIINLDVHDIIARNITNNTLQFTNEDLYSGLFDRLIELGVVPYKTYSGGNTNSFEGATITASSEADKTITVSNLISIPSEVIIYVPNVHTIAFNQDINRWSTRYSFNPDYMISSANSIVSFKNGVFNTHIMSGYNGVIGRINANRFYDVYYNSSIQVPFNENVDLIKNPLALGINANQGGFVDYAINERGQITTLNATDFDYREGKYWANVLRDVTTPNIPNTPSGNTALISGERIKGQVFLVKIEMRIPKKWAGGQTWDESDIVINSQGVMYATTAGTGGTTEPTHLEGIQQTNGNAYYKYLGLTDMVTGGLPMKLLSAEVSYIPSPVI